jgi:hypothetical protein
MVESTCGMGRPSGKLARTPPGGTVPAVSTGGKLTVHMRGVVGAAAVATYGNIAAMTTADGADAKNLLRLMPHIVLLLPLALSTVGAWLLYHLSF